MSVSHFSKVASKKYVHIDVMDGHFVLNITIDPLIVEALRLIVDETGAILDVHLMIEDLINYVDAFADVGADILTVHIEVATHLHRTIQAIRKCGVKIGVTHNLSTPICLGRGITLS